MNRACGFLLVLLLALPVSGQAQLRPTNAPPPDASSVGAPTDVSASVQPGRVAAQVAVGAALGVVAGFTGGALGAALGTANCDGGWCGVGEAALGAIVGYTVGTGLGVHFVGVPRHRLPVWWALGGAVLGTTLTLASASSGDNAAILLVGPVVATGVYYVGVLVHPRPPGASGLVHAQGRRWQMGVPLPQRVTTPFGDAFGVRVPVLSMQF